jgi:ribosomal protein S12 methylthiotransferase
MLPQAEREERRARFMAVAEAGVGRQAAAPRRAPPCRCWSTSAPALGRKGGVGRSYADAPEIDGTVRLLPPEKASKT